MMEESRAYSGKKMNLPALKAKLDPQIQAVNLLPKGVLSPFRLNLTRFS
jgi:hypothetical protein